MKTALAALTLALALPAPVRAQADPTPVDFTIAFIGDQGLGPDARAVLTLIRDEGAAAVLHSGDFEYTDDPQAWDDQINGILGQRFPYFASVGNHDADAFRGPGGYQEFLAARMHRLGVVWQGDLGVQSSFTYQGIFFVLTAPGVFGNDDGDTVYAPFIARALAADRSRWRISSWHKDMQLMQVGGKSDETGWGVYEAARRGGAIIATAHEHSYSRTSLLSSIEHQTVASTASPLVLARDDPRTPADEGRSFVFVSGLGGRSIREQGLDGPWWAGVYTATQGATYGALFGVFNYRGDAGLAHFYFKDIGGRVVDEFLVQSATADESPPCTDPTCDCRGRPDGGACDDGNPCTRDTCDGTGVCLHLPGNADTVCRPADDPCERPSTCSGESVDCPAPARKTGTAAVTCVFQRPLKPAACRGASPPAAIRRSFARARTLATRFARATPVARRRFLERVAAQLYRMRRLIDRGKPSGRRRLPAGCIDALHALVDDALGRVVAAAPPGTSLVARATPRCRAP